MCLRVDLQEPWLADVGFGELFLEPLRLTQKVEQTDPAGNCRIVQREERWQVEKAERGGDWKKQYSFTLRPRRLEEFAAMCHYHQTSPESHFTRNNICSLATADGRITLSCLKLIVTKKGVRTETTLASEADRNDVLKEYFGIIEDSAR